MSALSLILIGVLIGMILMMAFLGMLASLSRG